MSIRWTLPFALLFACGGEPERDARPAPVPEPADQAEAPPMVSHGDHFARHGGVVWMQSDDLHFEVVLSPSGEYRVYFSDAVREDLPAAVGSDVAVTLRRGEGGEEERVSLQIDEYGESWVGQGAPVERPAETTAIVGFVYRGEPYELEFPFDTLPLEPGAPDPHPGAGPPE